MFELKTDPTKYTTDETKATNFIAGHTPTKLTDIKIEEFKTTGFVTVDGVKYTYLATAAATATALVTDIYKG